jgi:hypothetical protein
MKNLTELEYGVLMQAINNAKAEIADDNFIDPYNNEEGHTNEQVLAALESAENKLIEKGFIIE